MGPKLADYLIDVLMELIVFCSPLATTLTSSDDARGALFVLSLFYSNYLRRSTSFVIPCLHLLYPSESNDPEFDELNRKMTAIEGAMEKLLKDTKVFTEGVTSS